MRREEAFSLVESMVNNQNLINHMLCVEAAMRFYCRELKARDYKRVGYPDELDARKFHQDEDLWGVTGLLHDADWEKYPTEHPQEVMRRLKEHGAHPDIVQAINAHGGKDAIEPITLMDKALFACDELSGFVVAVARMRPDKLIGMEPSSIKKKLKDKGFAAGVNRDDIARGVELLGIDLDTHISNIIEAISPLSEALFL